jgi:hypothetical protein
METKLFYKYENKSDGKNNFVMKEKALHYANRNCFNSPEEATKHYKNAYKIALKKYNNIMDGLRKLKEINGDFSFEYFMNGDTHGIYEDGLYISIEVDGYNFEFEQ